MNARSASPFTPRTVLGLLLFGALAFVLTLYFIGIDETGANTNNGGGHGAGKGLNGFAALVKLAELNGNATTLVRNEGQLRSGGLLVLTPPHEAKPEDLAEIVNGRRYIGPTLIVVPKWQALPVGKDRKNVKPGWVELHSPKPPSWPGFADEITLRMDDIRLWRGAGQESALAAHRFVQSGAADNLVPLVTDGDGSRILAGYLADDGRYPALNELAGFDPALGGDDEGLYPVIFVFEPDLLDNYGMAHRPNALMATRLIDAALHDAPPTVAFDLTQNGLGRSMNLLTLAFTPPFLAATLCLIIAAIVVGWRALRRFGPPLAESRAIAFGKRQLVRNSAGFIRRTGRLNLLGPPYAQLMRRRIARALGLTWQEDSAAMDSRIETALAARGGTPAPFSAMTGKLGQARKEHELLRAAEALKQIERMLGK